MATYVDLNTVHNPATGTVAPAAWGDQIREDLEFLIDPPSCSVFHSTTINASTATLTSLSADQENFDNNAMHSTVTNNSRITAVTAGRYLVSILAEFQTNPSGIRVLNLRKNGTTDLPGIRQQPVTGFGSAFNFVSSITLAAADFIEARAYQDSGSTLTVQLYEFSALFLTR